MGNEESVRSSHFHNSPHGSSLDEEDVQQEPCRGDPDDDDPHISISNKMVERLVEDAALVGGAKAAVQKDSPSKLRTDYKDKIFIEKLKILDDKHSQKTGLTVEEVNSTAKRIEMRTAHTVNAEPICESLSEQIIDCYNTKNYKQQGKCYGLIEKFSKCVEEASAERLRMRNQKEVREQARRSRHIAEARESTLKLGPWPATQDSS